MALAERVVALQGWPLTTSLLCLCAEALAADPACVDSSVGRSFEATADCGDSATSRNGVMDSAAAAPAAATRQNLHVEGGSADVATAAGRRGRNMDERLHALSGVVLAVALLDRLTASVKLAERRAGSCRVKAGPQSLHARGGAVFPQ